MERFIGLNNLTSFTLKSNHTVVNAENFRTFILNNQSLKTLSLEGTRFEGSSNGPPIILSNLKSLTVHCTNDSLPTIFRVPALQRLSSLSVFPSGDCDHDYFTCRAIGDDITFTVKDENIVGAWRNLTGYARPTIQHVRLDNPDNGYTDLAEGGATTWFMDVHTLEIGRGYAQDFYPEFWDDLKESGPQLKIIRFEISEATEPHQLWEREYKRWGGKLLDSIQELVTYRFEHGRPFSAVERMVISKCEWVNRQQDIAWRWFYNDRHLGEYIQHE